MAFRKSPLLTTAASLIALTALSGCASSPFASREPLTAESHNAMNYDEAMKRGAVALADQDFAEASKNYMRASEYKPEDVQPLIALADVLWQEKKAAESAKILEHAHRLDANNDTVLRNLGRAYVALNEPVKAQNAYLNALQIDPNSARTLNGLAISYDLAGDHETAQEHYRAGLALEPNNVDIKNNLAYSHLTAKNYNEAIKILEGLVKHPAATSRQRNNLALAYGLVGRDEDAKLALAVDHAPAQVERNIKTYEQMRGEPTQAQSLTGVGRPNFENGSLATVEPEPQPMMATPPRYVSATEIPAPPGEMTGVPDGAVLVKPQAPEVEAPKPAATELPAPTATTARSQPVTPVQALLPTPTREQPVELVAAAPAPAAVAPATSQPAASLSAPAAASSMGSSKIYLGRFENEGQAREAWIKVWTSNSASLSSLVASIEPNAGQMALYAVGSESAEAANAICLKLRQNGISCGVGN